MVKNVKSTLVQALRLRTGCPAHRRSRVIALLFLDHGTRRGVSGQRHAPGALYPRERPGTHCTGGWVGPRAGLGKKAKAKQPVTGPEGLTAFQEVKVPRFRDNGTGWWQLVSLTHRPPLPPGNTPGTHFF